MSASRRSTLVVWLGHRADEEGLCLSEEGSRLVNKDEFVGSSAGSGLLAGRVVFLAGVGAQIGSAAALIAAREGAKVALAARTTNTTEALAETIRSSGGAAIALTCDVGDGDQLDTAVRSTVEHLGPVDAVFYNAAHSNRPTTEQDPFELDDAAWASSLNVNLRGASVVAALTIPSMLANGRGAFVFTSSSSSLVAEEVSLGYGVFKAGLNALTRFIASRYGRQGIRANAVLPFVVQGPRGRSTAALTCLGRSGTPEEVGEVVAFLCSDRAGAVTGQMIHVDCGLQAKAHWPSAFVPEAPMAQLFGLWESIEGRTRGR
jgi:NAD(P)-dependent dehydrogenase (short-subunit alcohol dehydrogenase family)